MLGLARADWICVRSIDYAQRGWRYSSPKPLKPKCKGNPQLVFACWSRGRGVSGLGFRISGFRVEML